MQTALQYSLRADRQMVQSRVMAADLSEAHWLIFPKETSKSHRYGKTFYLYFPLFIISACHLRVKVSRGLSRGETTNAAASLDLCIWFENKEKQTCNLFCCNAVNAAACLTASFHCYGMSLIDLELNSCVYRRLPPSLKRLRHI